MEAADTYHEESFHVRCVAHIISNAIMESRHVVYDKIDIIRNLLNSIRLSVKLHDKLNTVRVEFNCEHEITGLYSETLWCSTF